MEKKTEEIDRRSGWMTISRNGQGWTPPAQLGKLKTVQGGKGLLRDHRCGAPTALQSYGIEKDRNQHGICTPRV